MMGLDGGRRLMENEQIKAANVGQTLSRFVKYLRGAWVFALIALSLVVFATWTQVVAPDLIGQAVDCYLFPQDPAECTYADITTELSQDAKLAGLTAIVLTLFGLFALGAVGNGIAFFFMNLTGQSVLRGLRRDLFGQMQALSLSYYSEHEVGDIMSRVTSDTDTIQQVFNFGLLSVIGGALLIVWIGAKMLLDNFAYGLISLAVVPVMFIATVYFSNQARKAFRKSRQEMGSVNADLQENIAGVREVQAFNRESESIEQFTRVNAANRDANVRASAFTSALTPVLEALGYVAIAVVVIIGGVSVLRDTPLIGTAAISLGTVFVYLQYVQRFNQPIQQIAILWTNIQSAIAGAERIFGLIDQKVEITDKVNAIAMPPIDGRVELDHVAAGYKTGQPVLKDVSFTAEPGQMIAIVGPTGAGKTTIINLIPRFYDVTEGAVRIDGHDVRDVTMASLRGQIGIVLQDSFLFSDTVMNNIRYGRLEATDEEVIEAAKTASAHGFIEALPEGYQTILGERGSGLSQGQRQLISIARVALMNPRILILDEATSSVDTRTEKMIQKAFGELLKGRTSFVIAHRLSTIRNADQLMVLKDGEIVERGNHHTLLEAKGEYYDLYMSQFRHEETADQAVPAVANGNGHNNGFGIPAAQPSGD